MRSLRWALGVAVVVLVGACSSASHPMPVEFREPLDDAPAAAGATGAAVQEGVICAEGTFRTLRMENADGGLVSDEEGQRLWQEALESGATLHMTL